jgi:organic hydroperoxide reductase OsmC/OhrA
MKPLPHLYAVTASASDQSPVQLESAGLHAFLSAPPVEFDGPGNLWSPETLLMAALSDCFILTFRAIAKASMLNWISLKCDTYGTVDRLDATTSFTSIEVRARLVIPQTANMEKAEKLLAKSRQSCLIANSLKVTPTYKLTVAIELAA